MDPEIWSRLPEELLEHVLSFLPLKTFLNLRSTCKLFKSLTSSPSFMSKHSSSSSSTKFSSFLLLSHRQCHHQFPLYDFSVGAWRNLHLPPSVLLPPISNSSGDSSALLSSSNGLLCFSVPSSSSLLVCNLLAKSSRIINFPAYPFDLESLTLVSTPSGYKIFTLYSKYSSNYALVYESKNQSWTKVNSFESVLRDSSNRQESVYYNGSLYFTTSEPFSVLRFDLDNNGGGWARNNTLLPSELVFVRLVSDGNRKLYLIGGVGRNGISRSLKMWELSDHENENKWVEVESLPELMCRKFMAVCYHNYEHVYCFCHQGMICVCCYTWPEVLYYKVSRRTWHWLSKCPSVPERWSCGFRWFSFVPDLYALV
ncbi:hypothetical protein Ddye_006671 [Dipteronia dyeriana]|uniref:F-box domain-containing protein n=1 Tax=Dipteronia dyeriana TaxID=168575 RepID=A0AAD9XIV3_9ROSI|nr:hypothetical protein Ddye_006671 [Dipteronia dyeriana]